MATMTAKMGLSQNSLLKPCSTRGRSAFRTTSATAPSRRCVVVRAQADDDELEARLAKLRQAKGATPYGEGAKQEKRATKKPEQPAKQAAKKEYDFTDETLYYEGPPHRGDLAVNLVMATTLVWLPLTAAAVGRGAFVSYRFTDRRLSVKTAAPWKNEQTDIAYQEVKDVVTVPRGLGLWGDMVVTLNDNSKIELRSLDRFRELKTYILERRDALTGRSKPKPPSITDLDADDDAAIAANKAEQKRRGFS